MTVKSLFGALLFAVALALPLACGAAPLKIGATTLEKDTTWQGEVLVTGDVYVPVGITLTVLPGTVVKFVKIDPSGPGNLFGVDSPYYPQAELIVTGRLLARGTAEKPIVFTSAEKKPDLADWGSLNFLGSKGNLVEHCRIEYAYNGVHAHGAEVRVSDSVFRNNAVAISVKKEEEAKGTPGFGVSADLTVTGCLLEDNKGGINVRTSRAVIRHNTLRNNKFFGIWVKEECSGEIRNNDISANKKGIFFYKAQGMTITANNIHDNLDYNLAIADEQAGEVQVAGNWLGSTDPEKISGLIFDGRADPSVGRIVVEPFLKEPVRNAGR
jgi:parallel beta-helix repeat protein